MMSLVLIAPTALTGCCRVVLTDLSLQCCLDIWAVPWVWRRCTATIGASHFSARDNLHFGTSDVSPSVS